MVYATQRSTYVIVHQDLKVKRVIKPHVVIHAANMVAVLLMTQVLPQNVNAIPGLPVVYAKRRATAMAVVFAVCLQKDYPNVSNAIKVSVGNIVKKNARINVVAMVNVTC